MTSPAADPQTGRATYRRGPDRPAAAVLFLHGGTERSDEPVGRRSGPLWRMGLLRDALGRTLRQHDASSWLLRYGQRGWNGPQRSPVADARWALEQIRERDGDVPVVLVGHSMGGRTGAAVVDDPNVVGLVALAPWFEPADPVAPFAGRRLIAAHGSRDKITSARATRAYVDRAARVADSARFVDMGRLGHYLLAGAGRWHETARRATAALLDDRPF